MSARRTTLILGIALGVGCLPDWRSARTDASAEANLDASEEASAGDAVEVSDILVDARDGGDVPTTPDISDIVAPDHAEVSEIADVQDVPPAMDEDAGMDVPTSVDEGVDVPSDVQDVVECAMRCPPGQSCASAGGACAYRARKVAIGTNFACALMWDGSVFCWGVNDVGQLGIGGPVDGGPRLTPVLLSGVSDAVDITAMRRAVCVVHSDGRLVCWGNNPCGGLGDEDGGLRPRAPDVASNCTDDGNFPVNVSPREINLGLDGGQVAGVAAGGDHLCVWTRDGLAYCWGSSNNGITGTGRLTDAGSPTSPPDFLTRPMPVLIEPAFGSTPARELRGVVELSSLGTTTCALVTSTDGGIDAGPSIHCWGANSDGRAGIGTVRDQPFAEQPVSGLSSAPVSVSVGTFHVCARTADGHSWCWGSNAYAELGQGARSSCAHPVPLEVRVGRFSLVAAGSRQTCGVEVDSGTLRCWGQTENVVSLGDVGADLCADDGVRHYPCPDAGTDAGPTTRCAFNPLVIRTLQGSNLVPITGVEQVALGAEGSHACVLLRTGDVFCWGIDGNAVGSGTTGGSDRPLFVDFARAVDAGS